MSEEKGTTLVEEWRDIAGYEGHYQVSNFGRIKSLARTVPSRRYPSNFKRLRERIMAQQPLPKGGHRTLVLHLFGVARTFLVHRLVLETFVGPCPEGMECCHFPDRDTGNNRLDNLQWGTGSENMRHAKIHGTLPVKVTWSISEETRAKRSVSLKRAWKRRKGLLT